MKASDAIRDALQEINVQASEQPLSGDETLTAIRYLNRMVQSWPFDLNYTKIESPSDEVTVPGYAERAVVLNLALELASQFDEPVTPGLARSAADAYLNMLTQTQEIEEAEYTNNVPLGSGNRYPGSSSPHFYPESD